MKEKAYIPNERLLDAAKGSIYTLTVLAAKRALALAEEEKPLVEDSFSVKTLDIALQEIDQKKIKAK